MPVAALPISGYRSAVQDLTVVCQVAFEVCSQIPHLQLRQLLDQVATKHKIKFEAQCICKTGRLRSYGSV